ncbi:MAG: class I SAM-dependent methyltransferase [Aliiglaciecola sp.]|uniref:class I SAM-dependent methyltransferase n=1 Tax=Aliiglaciecola sp. TaxID=1872441 RepID=UPI00329718AD
MCSQNKTIDFYNSHAAELFQQYQSTSFQKVHKHWASFLHDLSGKRALDIGAGSGRDASALAELGFKVCAVEPAIELSQLSKNSNTNEINWIIDSLPMLSQLPDEKYDVILVSAVWMHLTEKEQRLSLHRINSLINTNGIVVITIRIGCFSDERTSENVDVSSTIKEAANLGLICRLDRIDEDKLNRSDLNWQTIVFSKKELPNES